MIDVLTGAELKLNRAQSHISEIGQEVANFVASTPFRWETTPAPELGWQQVVIRLLSPIPDILSVIVGDAIHNLRSSLDNMVSALARHNGVTSSSQLKKVYFPTGGSKPDFEQACSSLEPLVGARAYRALLDLEVFDGGRGEILKTLGTLSNIDKHRLLIPAIPAMRSELLFGLTRAIVEKGDPAKVEVKIGPLAVGKAPVAEGDVLISFPDTNHREAPILARPTLSVALDSSRLPPGEDVVTSLIRMHTAATDTLQALRGSL